LFFCHVVFFLKNISEKKGYFFAFLKNKKSKNKNKFEDKIKTKQIKK